MKSPSRATTTCLIWVSATMASSLCAKFSMMTIDGGAGVGELLFQFARRVERIDVDDDQPGAQRAEERHRIGEQVRQHDGDAVARPELRFLDEERRERAADAFPLGIGHRAPRQSKAGYAACRAQASKQHRRKRRIGIRIDAFRDAWRVRSEPDWLLRAGRRRHGRALGFQCHFSFLGRAEGPFPSIYGKFRWQGIKAALFGRPSPPFGWLHPPLNLTSQGGQAKSLSRRVSARALQTTTEAVRVPRNRAEGAERREAQFHWIRAHRQTLPLADARARMRAADKCTRSAQLICLRGALAFRRSTCGSRQDFHILAQLQARLPGTRVRRALPALACPSPVEAPHAPAVVPEGMMPKAARERFAKPRAGAALAPLSGVPSRRRPRMSKIALCNQIRYKSQDVSQIVTSLGIDN